MVGIKNTVRTYTYIYIFIIIYYQGRYRNFWARGRVVVEALCCKPEGRGIASRLSGFFYLPNPFGRTVALGSTRPLIEMSTRYRKKEIRG
jgi:hypothetical protein